MNPSVSPKMRDLLQEFVDARIDMPDLFARAGQLLPAGGDPSEEILELLADADLKLRLPPGRQPFIHRLQQFARGETSYTELDLWAFSLGQTEALADEAVPGSPEVALLRTVVEWIDEWEEESERPAATEIGELAYILQQEPDPVACLARLEESVARFRRL